MGDELCQMVGQIGEIETPAKMVLAVYFILSDTALGLVVEWVGGGVFGTTSVLWICRYKSKFIAILFLYLQIIRERLPDYPTRNSYIWNTSPGALLTLPNFADSSRFVVVILTYLLSK